MRVNQPSYFAMFTPDPTIWMFSDAARLPDWHAAISRQPRHVGLLLRDYTHAQRNVLATEMAEACRRQGRAFAVAGDRRLARHLGAGFHCPSYLLARPAARLGSGQAGDTAAVHNMAELTAARRAGFDTIFISPVFQTTSHDGARTLGTAAHILFRAAQQAGMKAHALGGMDPQSFRRLTGHQPRQNEHGLHGWAAIDFFARGGQAP